MSYKYENGEVVEQPTMEKPSIFSIEYALNENERINFIKNFTAYSDHIKNRKHCPVPEQYRHVWKEGQPLEEGKDFKMAFEVKKENGELEIYSLTALGLLGTDRRVVAIPIEPKQSAIKPPIGLMPEWRHKELRLEEINDAIDRYYESNYSIPKEWLSEQEYLIIWLKKYLPTSPHIEPKQQPEMIPPQLDSNPLAFYSPEPFQYGTQGAHAMQEQQDKVEVQPVGFEKIMRGYFHMFSDEDWQQKRHEFPYNVIPFICAASRAQLEEEITDLQFKIAELESALQAEKFAHGLTQAALEELEKEVQRLKDLKA